MSRGTLSTSVTERLQWANIGKNWTAAVTTPAVSARSYEDVKAIVPLIHLDNVLNALELRFTGSTDGHSLVFDILACRGQGDYFHRIATATCTVGTSQKGSATVLFVDTIVLSNIVWPTNKIAAVSNAANYQGSVWLDTLGYLEFALIPTTVNGTASYDYSGV